MKSNGVIKIIVVAIVIFFSASCKEEQPENKYENIPFLHEIKGTENYEIIRIGESLGGNAKWDSIKQIYLIESFNKYYKFSIEGTFIDSINKELVPIIDSNRSFPDEVNFYTTWLDNGDKKEIEYIDIIKYQPSSRDTILYKKKHLDFYQKSSIVKYSNYGYYYYYYYYKGNWYRMTTWGDRWIKKHYPEKLPPPRLKDIEIKRFPPAFVRQFYVPTKKHKGGDVLGEPQSFSTGFWVIHLGLPGGDTLVYRRLGDGLSNLSTFYQLPSSRGGNDSVLFISQEYNNQKGIDGGVYFTHGGLFMLRPRRK